jgi:tetratricopeptide (TPR) repeat protein
MPSKALEYLTSAQSVYERILPEKHLLTIEILGHIGAVHEASNNFSSAIELFHRQLNWSEVILPLDHPLLNIYLDSVLRVYTKINQTSKINALFDERLQKLNKILGEYHPLIPRLILMVASLLESSQPLEAIRLYDQALQISESSKQSDRSILLKSHQNLARLYRKFANLKEALGHALRALSYQQQISSEKENRLFEADELHNIGSIYLEMGSFTDALQYLTKSLTMHQPIYAIDHPTVQAILFDIGRAANQSRFN